MRGEGLVNCGRDAVVEEGLSVLRVVENMSSDKGRKCIPAELLSCVVVKRSLSLILLLLLLLLNSTDYTGFAMEGTEDGGHKRAEE